MNERIAKLYDQAIVIEDGEDYVCGELDIEKFAELIMQESRKWVGLTDEPVGRFAKFTDGVWREVTDGSAGVPLYRKEKNT